MKAIVHLRGTRDVPFGFVYFDDAETRVGFDNIDGSIKLWQSNRGSLTAAQLMVARQALVDEGFAESVDDVGFRIA